jgi:hypothetical protein
MTTSENQKDLVVLTADKNTEHALRGILTRFQALGIRQPTHDIYVHPHRDPGCFREGHDFLRLFRFRYTHALVLFDREGCGQEQRSREILEQEVETRLFQSGWDDRASVIVLNPELEIWIWSDSPHVASILGWEGKTPDLKTWLIEQALLAPAAVKPARPKEAMEGALRTVKKPRSSDLYLKLATQVSLDRCVDPAFLKLKSVLKQWFV